MVTNMTILVTGGCGYIGSHTVFTLLSQNYDVVVLDDLSNASEVPLQRIAKMTTKRIRFYKGRAGDEDLLNTIFSENEITSVIHFAGLKSVSESIEKPLEYYMSNLTDTVKLLNVMIQHKIYRLIFSSSATVYGRISSCPINELNPTGNTTNPYGTTKFFAEEILKDVANANQELKIIILRYFNPIGAHPSGLLGEHPNGIPNNLFPYLTKVALGTLPYLAVFGNDYPTPDGSGVRDYIHVMDLAEAHVKALNHVFDTENVNVYNLGTGIGYSVLEIISAFEKVTGISIPYKIIARRPGDIASCWSDCTKANEKLKWRATRDISVMIQDAWNWQIKNPNGYIE